MAIDSTMQHIHITQASITDITTLQLIGKQTFSETFASHNTEADMQQYLDNNFSTDKLNKELKNPGSQFYIAWDEHTPIGYLKVNTGTAQTELQNDDALEIERIYVASDYHGKKVGQLPYEKALEVAQALNKPSIWLGVWEENHKAIRFYEKNGFVAFDKHIFKLGNDEQTDIMMKKVLQ
jgi:diamine N-acetyltransferase